MSRIRNKENKVPMRKCIGCGQSFEQKSLCRIALYEDNLSFDNGGNAKGRGVYLCKNDDCINMAVKKKAICRSFRRNFNQEAINQVFNEVRKFIEEN